MILGNISIVSRSRVLLNFTDYPIRLLFAHLHFENCDSYLLNTFTSPGLSVRFLNKNPSFFFFFLSFLFLFCQIRSQHTGKRNQNIKAPNDLKLSGWSQE